jgi:outer membrane receptor protein involved in Fe transport
MIFLFHGHLLYDFIFRNPAVGRYQNAGEMKNYGVELETAYLASAFHGRLRSKDA